MEAVMVMVVMVVMVVVVWTRLVGIRKEHHLAYKSCSSTAHSFPFTH